VASRLQLGTSRLEDLDRSVLDRFLDRSWIHLGDAPSSQPPTGSRRRYLRTLLHEPRRFFRTALDELRGRSHRPQLAGRDPAELYAATDFREFYYRKGDRLPFDDATFDFVFSEHFLHHLFFDDALALLRECARVLKPRGVMRTVVPDADLRTYEPPEPVGFPDVRMPFDAPLKHKTRYSVYLLSEALRLAGLEPVPLRYCDRHGTYVRREPAELREAYRGCPEPTLVYELDYVRRLDSLIVDGMKPRGGGTSR
jgi:predicted SAM-dependent methyltransferase